MVSDLLVELKLVKISSLERTESRQLAHWFSKHHCGQLSLYHKRFSCLYSCVLRDSWGHFKSPLWLTMLFLASHSWEQTAESWCLEWKSKKLMYLELLMYFMSDELNRKSFKIILTLFFLPNLSFFSLPPSSFGPVCFLFDGQNWALHPGHGLWDHCEKADRED